MDRSKENKDSKKSLRSLLTLSALVIQKLLLFFENIDHILSPLPFPPYFMQVPPIQILFSSPYYDEYVKEEAS